MGSMNRITDKGFTGTLCFAKNLKLDYFSAFDCTEAEFHEIYNDDKEYIFLGSCELDVQFEVDTRQAEIEALEAVREKMRAEMGAAIGRVTDKIESLRALPNLAGGEA